MKESTERTLRISKLVALKKSAEANAKRIRKMVLKGHKTNVYGNHWAELAVRYQNEINQLKQI